MKLRTRYALTSRPPSSQVPLTRLPELGDGRPLQPQTRATMDARFGHDFSSVRIHAGDTAARVARSANANALAVGNHILFGSGRYPAQSRDSERLLAHELAHVVQQDRSGPGDPTRASHRDDPSEREARRAADLVSAGSPVRISAAPDAAIARDDNDAQKKGFLEWSAERLDNPLFEGMGHAMDNPLFSSAPWVIGTDNSISGAISIGEEGSKALDASARYASMAKQDDLIKAAIIRQGGPPPATAGPEITPTPGAEAQNVEDFINTRTFDPAAGGLPKNFDPETGLFTAAQDVENAAADASNWAKVGRGFGTAGKVLAPVGVVSNAVSMRQDIQQGNWLNAGMDAGGLASSGIGTAGALGAELPTLGPIGAVLGALVGGYAAGSAALGWANSYAKAHNLFGENRDSTEAAGDAGVWMQEQFEEAGLPGWMAKTAGATTSIFSSWGTAAYSGLHAAGSKLGGAFGGIGSDIISLVEGNEKVDMDAVNEVTAGMGANLDQIDAQETEKELEENMSYSSSAHEELPPQLQEELKKKK